MVLPNFRCKLYLDQCKDAVNLGEKSNVVYLDVVNAHADNRETVKYVLDNLAKEFHESLDLDHLLVVGDAKTFDHLEALKVEYGEDLDWMIPFPGDFHVLMNYQPIIMKVFWDAGLSNLGKVLHNGPTLTSLNSCSDFRRTHAFILHAWECVYRNQIKQFFKWRESIVANNNNNCDGVNVLIPYSTEYIVNKIVNAIKPLAEQKHSGFSDVDDFISKQELLLMQLKDLKQEFENFRNVQSQHDETFRFWDSFIHRDCAYYIGLWLAIRSGNWDLRMSCLKHMLPLFSVTDHHNYARILPKHFSTVDTMPDDVLHNLKMGGFVVSLKGTPFASLALDEAHESTINRDVKMSITNGDQDNIATLVKYLPFRAGLLDNFKFQLFHKSKTTLHEDLAPSMIDKENENICKYHLLWEDKASVFPVNKKERALTHIFTGKEAADDVKNDLLNYHKQGQERVDAYVDFVFLKKSSIKVSIMVLVQKTLKGTDETSLVLIPMCLISLKLMRLHYFRKKTGEILLKTERTKKCYVIFSQNI